jgi:cytochrome c oxidase cbb3-type subunit 3
MADAPDRAFEHDYDGIQEYDNPLPRWWVWLFVATTAWGVAYVPWVHLGPGAVPVEEYEADMKAWYDLHPPAKLASDDELAAMARQPELVSAGAPIFQTRCASCHLMDGGGLVGPNLTDDFSLHGFAMPQIVRVIHDGVPDKGMIAWKGQLRLDEIYAVAAYVRSLRGTKPASPKAPQGDPIRD